MTEISQVPRVMLHERGGGKFIQLFIKEGDIEVPIFACRQRHCYHAVILSSFLDGFGLKYHFEMDDENKIMIPDKQGENYRLVGAGNLWLYQDINKLWIEDQSFSFSYDTGFNPEHFEKVKEHFPKGLEVKFK